jgi:hypothetical protein
VNKQPLTLNELINKKTKSNAKGNINCSKLFKQHQPKSIREWGEIVSKQKCNVLWITKDVLNKQAEYGCSYEKSKILDYVYMLLVENTYNGMTKEITILHYLQNKFKNLLFSTNEEYDNEYAVDIDISNSEKEIIGAIQVKPYTYNNEGREADVLMNKNKNNRFKEKFTQVKEVFYLYYNKSNWLNEKEFLAYINQLAQ